VCVDGSWTFVCPEDPAPAPTPVPAEVPPPEDCGVDLCSAYGWPMERCAAHGFAMVLRRHQIEYGEPLSLGDEFEVSSWASGLRRSSAIRHYLIGSGGKQAARLRSQYVWVDLDTMRPIRIPEAFLEDFRSNFSGGDAEER